MAGTDGSHSLRVWSLATFRVATFMVAAALYFHVNDTLQQKLSSLNTALGFGAFLYLWLTTWHATRMGVRSMESDPRVDWTIDATMVAGGWNGLYIFILPAAGIVITALVSEQPLSALPIFVVVTVIGSIAAFVIGLIVGLAYGLTEAVLFRASTALLHRADVPGISPLRRDATLR